MTTTQTHDYLLEENKALKRQLELLRLAIKKTWRWVKYDLPVSLEISVSNQPDLTEDYNVRTFKGPLDATLTEAKRILSDLMEPVHYSLIVDAVKRNHAKMLARWTKHELGDKANLAGKVRDLKTMDYLVRVGKGTYFFGPKLAEMQKEPQQ